jgi:hypothetical protein
MKKIIFTVLAVTALTGCSKWEQITDGQVPESDGSGVPVQLNGSITDITRGDGQISTGTVIGLTVFRVNKEETSKDVYAYPSDYSTAKILTGSMAADNKITLDPPQKYSPNTSVYTKFIGVYPAGGTENVSARTVTYSALDGTTDIMVSAFTAERNKEGNTTPTLNFSHLLTGVKVLVKAGLQESGGTEKAAELADIIEQWGNITAIAVKDKKTDAVVTLPVPTTNDAASIAADGVPADLPLTKKSDNNSVSAITLAEAPQEFGYAMFLPFSSAKLELLLNTSTAYIHAPKTVSTDAGQTYDAGKNYAITLSFKLDGTVGVDVGIEGDVPSNWEDGSGHDDEIELN